MEVDDDDVLGLVVLEGGDGEDEAFQSLRVAGAGRGSGLALPRSAALQFNGQRRCSFFQTRSTVSRFAVAFEPVNGVGNPVVDPGPDRRETRPSSQVLEAAHREFV